MKNKRKKAPACQLMHNCHRRGFEKKEGGWGGRQTSWIMIARRGISRLPIAVQRVASLPDTRWLSRNEGETTRLRSSEPPLKAVASELWSTATKSNLNFFFLVFSSPPSKWVKLAFRKGEKRKGVMMMESWQRCQKPQEREKESSEKYFFFAFILVCRIQEKKISLSNTKVGRI